MHEHDPLISEYSHERARPREAEALHMLRKVASIVKPIMRQRGWRVGMLTEFYPPERNLLGLNWNRGQKICLRLRYPEDERQFMPLENIIDTMLHELAHIVHGPHDSAFHALWDQLRDEHEALVRKGYTGEGFLSTGRKLGGSNRVPMSEARRLARQAAEQRRTLGKGSGQKLGGAPVRRGDDIRTIIADAASRRMNVTRGCAGGEDLKRREEIVEEVARRGWRTRAEEDDANERAIMDAYIELIQEEERTAVGGAYEPPSQRDPLGSQGRRKVAEEQAKLELEAAGLGRRVKGKAAPPAIPPHSTPAATSKPPASKSPSSPLHHPPPPDLLPEQLSSSSPYSSAAPNSWPCSICTVLNPPLYLTCSVCETERTFGEVASTPAPTRPRSNRPSSTSIARALRKKRSRETLAQLDGLNTMVQARPLGWACGNCGTFMEREFWVCVGCGKVKERS